jgi:lipopolysaccharide/colanic/teichoic acid biosynthesis glycosyltransferase
MLRNRFFSQQLSAPGLVLDFPVARPWYERGAEVNLLSEAAYQSAKRLMDIVVCLALLPLVLPLIALCVIAIKLDSPGPAFFKQSRTGKGGRSFKIFKLRTMVKNAAELREKYLHLNELTLPDFKITNDPRLTRVGRILRKLSFDELPQIFNVLLGHMSLVGPRPSSYAAATYNLWHTARFELKPGITGLAQVCGRSELHLDDKLRYDIAYLRNQSFWLDLQILFRTIGVVLAGRGVK